jgi:hypothetical protein
VAQISVKTNPKSGSVLSGNQQPALSTGYWRAHIARGRNVAKKMGNLMGLLFFFI